MPRSSTHKWLPPTLALLTLFMLVPGGFAQSTGEVTGTMVDSTQAVVPGSTLRLSNTATNVSTSTQSNADGLFHFPSVPPGTYAHRYSHGFLGSPAYRNRCQCQPHDRRQRRIEQRWRLSERVTVNAGASRSIPATATRDKSSIREKWRYCRCSRAIRWRSLRLRRELLSQRWACHPSIGQRWRRHHFGLRLQRRVRTGPGGFDEYLVDGVSMTNWRDGTIQALPSEGSIQEFQVQSGGLPPALGYTVGGVVNYVTKSGTTSSTDFSLKIIAVRRRTLCPSCRWVR